MDVVILFLILASGIIATDLESGQSMKNTFIKFVNMSSLAFFVSQNELLTGCNT